LKYEINFHYWKGVSLQEFGRHMICQIRVTFLCTSI